MQTLKEEKDTLKKEIEGWLLFFLSREKKLKSTIDKIYEKNEKTYLSFYEENKKEMENYKKVLNENQIETFKKLIGIHFEAVANSNPENMKKIIIRMDTDFNRFISKKKTLTTEDLGEIFDISTNREITQGRFSPLDTYKNALMPSFLVNCYDFQMTEELMEAQKRLFNALKKDVLLEEKMDLTKENPSKEMIEEWNLKGVSKLTTAISVSNIIWENKTKSIIFEKFPFKKQSKTKINITEYKNVYKDKTDLSSIGKLTDFVFKMNNLEVTNFEPEVELKEIALIMKKIEKEGFKKNEKEVALILLCFINSLLKEKSARRDEEFEKSLEKEEAIKTKNKTTKEERDKEQELKNALKKIEELEKKVQELNYEKTVKEEMNKKLSEDNERKNKTNNTLLDKIEKDKQLEDEVIILRKAVYNDIKEDEEEDENDEKIKEMLEKLKDKKIMFVGGYKAWRGKMEKEFKNSKFYTEKTFINQNANFIRQYDYVVINNMGITHASTTKATSVFDNRDKIIFLIGCTNFTKTIKVLNKNI